MRAIATIKAGTGVTVDACDFIRLPVDTVIEYDPKQQWRKQEIAGTIAGDMEHPRSFMRRGRVQVVVQRRFLVEP